MDALYYNMIFKRKSFHILKETEPLSASEVNEIDDYTKKLIPLVLTIKTAYKIVPSSETTCKQGEYCILIYSEMKALSLQNVGYLGEQLDLWLASKNIGACWYGMGKTKEPSYQGLDFVIMLAIGKSNEKSFRKDYTKAKRKSLAEIWQGEALYGVTDVVRYAPSACNSQPWLLEYKKGELLLYRIKGKRGIVPQDKLSYYNKIDIGIMMLFIEICLQHEGLEYISELSLQLEESDKQLVTVYSIHKQAN